MTGDEAFVRETAARRAFLDGALQLFMEIGRDNPELFFRVAVDILGMVSGASIEQVYSEDGGELFPLSWN
jgi:hypothetical protein